MAKITKQPGEPGFGVDMSREEVLDFMSHKKPKISDNSKKFSRRMGEAMVSNLNNQVGKSGFKSR